MEPTILTHDGWQQKLTDGVEAFIGATRDMGDDLPIGHVVDTPERVVKAFLQMVEGLQDDPKEILSKKFDVEKHDQMIHRRNIRVSSTCAHHLKDIIGIAHFAYIPKDHIVGISKIPRLVRCFSRRLQVQERLTDQIVDAFYDIVQPAGCGLHIQAYHFCEIARGVKEHASPTDTTALRGTFKTNPTVRAEFLMAINRQEVPFP